MRKIRRQVYKFAAIILIFAIVLFIYIYVRHTQDDIQREIKIQIIERSIRSPLNQEECHHPNLPVDNPEIMKFYEPVEKLDCGNSLDDWVMCEKSICFVKPEISASHGDVMCSFTDLIRETDHYFKYGKPIKTKEPYVLQKSDFVKVVCSAENGASWHGMAYGIRDTVQLNNALSSFDANTDDPQYYNVLMFGFDSLSRNAVIRKLPKTYKYLTNQLNATVLNGYNIVGDGTPQALIPILTGYNELELPEVRIKQPGSSYVDIYPMIWKTYKRYGYATSYNEDCPKYGTFTYRLNGFQLQPVDHYMRTLYLNKGNWFKDFCFGHQPDHVVMLDYTKNFMQKYHDSPRFIFSFHGALSHDSINLIGAADDDIAEWLQELKEKHLLDNTILIFMSDHGNRFAAVRSTLQGKQEERLPFFSFTFPEIFKKHFPQQYANFLQNSERLTTPYDIHATLVDLLKIQSLNSLAESEVSTITEEYKPVKLTKSARKRSISLFDVIPLNRSCADAYIEPHWCACLRWEQLAVNDSPYVNIILKLATNIVDTINNATKEFRTLCAQLELHKVNWAMRLIPHKEMVQFKDNMDTDGFLGNFNDDMKVNTEMYQLQISATPGESLFEATISYNVKTFIATTKLSEVSRVNKYGTQANCIYKRNPELRKFCYCRT